MKKSRLIGFVIFALMCVFFVSSIASAKDVFRFANSGGPKEDYTYGAQQFVNNMAAMNPDIEVKLFSNGVLGNDRVTCEMVQQGSLDMCLIGQAQFSLFVNSILALDFPYMVEFDRNDKVLEAFTPGGSLGEYVDKKAGEVGFKLLMVLDTPFRSYAFTPKANVTDLASVKGKKVRVPYSPIEREFVNALSMNASPMGWTEVYTALQQGTVDGEIASIGSFAGTNRAEVENTILLTRHNMGKIFVLMNKNKFESLPPEEQKQFMEAAEKSMREEWAFSHEYDEKGRGYCKEHDIHLIELTAEEMAKVKDLVKPIYESYKDKIDQEFVKLIQDVQK